MGISIWNHLPGVSQVMGKDKIAKAYKSEMNANVQPRKDEIQISKLSQEYNTASTSLKTIPDVREDKIKELQEKINSGEYIVSDEEVADRFVSYLKGEE